MERIGLELRFIPSQVHANQTILDMFHRQPGDLFGKFGAFMAVDRCDQSHFHAILFRSFLRAVYHPLHYVMQGKTFGATQSHGRKTQLKVTDVILRRILHRLLGHTVDHIGRPVKKTQCFEFIEEVREGHRVLVLHLHQSA